MTQRDYLPKSGYRVTMPAGSLSVAVPVFTVSDTADEHDETFLLRIDDADSPIGAVVGSPSEAAGTITDNDAPPTVSISDASADEGSAVTFDVSLSATSRKTVTLTASTAPGTASGANTCSADDGTEDYQTRTRPITFLPTAIAATFTVAVCDDTATEPDETFTGTLTNPANATLGTASATATITDDDISTTTDRDQGDCPDGQHQHGGGPGPYCHADGPMSVPDCAAAPQHHVAHDAADPDVHHTLIVDPCPGPAVNCVSGDMHYHDNDPDADVPYCHNNAHQRRLPCDGTLRLFWEPHAAGGHVDEITLACPPPERIDVSLFGASGIRLQFDIRVDAGAVNPYAEPAREFRVYTTNDACSPSASDCAVPGTHYVWILQEADCTTDVTTMSFDSHAPQIVYLCSLVDLDHGAGTRLLRIILAGHTPPAGPRPLRRTSQAAAAAERRQLRAPREPARDSKAPRAQRRRPPRRTP